jgi:Uma2 family endonuclease
MYMPRGPTQQAIRVIVEVVSPGSDKTDQVEKMGEWASAGILFYRLVWISDNRDRKTNRSTVETVLPCRTSSPPAWRSVPQDPGEELSVRPVEAGLPRALASIRGRLAGVGGRQRDRVELRVLS